MEVLACLCAWDYHAGVHSITERRFRPMVGAEKQKAPPHLRAGLLIAYVSFDVAFRKILEKYEAEEL